MNSKLRKIIERHDILKILSVFIAIIIFLTVNPIVSNPIWNTLFESQQTMTDIPLMVNYDNEKYVITGVPSSIDVLVSGNEDQVRKISNQQDALIANINLENYTPGQYEVNSDLVSFNIDGASIKPTQDEFLIDVQERVSKEFPVSLNYINGDKLSQGILLGDSEMAPASVTIRGGNSDIESVTSVIALADLTLLDLSSNENSDQIEVPLVAYDKDGNRVNNITIEPSTIQLTQDYTIQSQKLPVVYEYYNNSTGMYVSSICPIEETDCDENYVEEVEVYGNADKINQLSSITYQIDLGKVDETGGEVSGIPVLESDIYIVDEDKHNYVVEFEEGETITVENVTVSLDGLSDEFTAVASSSNDTTVNVKVTGAKSIVENINKSDINVYIDLSSYTQPGTYDVPLLIRHNNNVTYELSKDQISVEITEKDISSTEEEAEDE